MNQRNELPQRLRITFGMGEPIRYTSHLDLARAWERMVRRAGLPLVYSQGYHPQPKMVFAGALSLGCTASGEMVDILLDPPVPPDQVMQALRPQLPAGLTLVDATPVPYRDPALPTLVRWADYEILVDLEQPVKIEEAQARCRTLLEQESLPRTYRNKSYDLRPRIADLQAVEAGEGACLIHMRLAAGQQGTGRPDEVLDAMGWGECAYRCHRQRLYLVSASN